MDGVKGKVIDLRGFIDYQRGSVVSKEILKSSNGNVTLFSFSAGEGLSEHTSPYDALVMVVEGAVEIAISGKSYGLKQGEMIIMPANKPHALKAVEDFKMLLVMIK